MSRIIALCAVAIVTLGACSNSTQYVTTWKDPTIPASHLRHTLAVFMTTDAGLRRMVEDKLAARLPGGIASYHVIPDSVASNVDSLRSHVTAGQFDGAVVMRLVDVQTRVTATGEDFYGYWGYWRSAYDPVQITTETLYSMESTLYRVKDGRLVWMGRSETVDPKNLSKLADYSVTFVINNMRKDGWVP